MEHLYFFYLFVTFSIGILSLGIAAAAAFKIGKAFAWFYLLFYFAFSLVMVAEITQVYIQVNLSRNVTAIVLICQSLTSFVIYIIMIAMPACTHSLFSSVRSQWRNGLFATFALFIFAVSRLIDLTDALDLEQLEVFILLPVILCSFLYGVRRCCAKQTQIDELFAKKWLVLLGGSFMLLAAELFLGGSEKISMSHNTLLLDIDQGIVLHPVAYCGLSILFAWHFLKHYLLYPRQASPGQIVPPKSESDTEITVESLCEPYHLSPREKEVLLLVLKGYSNARIKDDLCISLGTVKAHVSNIFQKIGVKRRYELLSHFREAPLPSVHPEIDNTLNQTKVYP